MEFVRNHNGNVIGIALEPPHDGADSQAMISVLPIPEGSTVGELPDEITQADELGNANRRIAELEAQLASGGPVVVDDVPTQTDAERIAELEAELAASRASSSSSSPSSPAPSAPYVDPSAATPGSPSSSADAPPWARSAPLSPVEGE